MTLVRAKRCPTCGCCNCEVIRETPEPTAADITIISGTWSEPGIPNSTTSSNAVLLHNTAMPVGMATLYAEFLVGTSNQDQLRLIILRQDASNYWYAQVAPNISGSDGQLKLFQVSGGTHTQRGTSQTIFGWDGSDLLRCQFCLFDGTIRVRVALEGEFPDPTNVAGVTVSFTYSLAGTKVGVGTGTVIGNGNFFRIQAYRHLTDPDCECTHGCLEITDPPPVTCEEPTFCCSNVTLPSTVFVNTNSGWLDGLTSTQRRCAHTYHTCAGFGGGDPSVQDPVTDLELTKGLSGCYDDGPIHRHHFLFGKNAEFFGDVVYCYFDSLRVYCDSLYHPNPRCIIQMGFGGLGGGGSAEYCEVEGEILSCDPLHIQSLDGGFELTE